MSTWRNDHRWTGRTDSEDGARGRRWHQVIQRYDQGDVIADSTQLALMGMACDLGVANNKGRVGARLGPDALRDALANQAWHQPHGVIDLGTVYADADEADDLDTCQAAYAQHITLGLNNSPFTIGLGGGHEIAWGSFQGLVNSQHITPDTRIGIINFDAHFDLRKPAPLTSSGTPFWQIAQYCEQHQREFNYACIGIAETANTTALFDFATHTKTQFLLDKDCQQDRVTKTLKPFLRNIDVLYVTLCLDVFPNYVAPGVSAPSGLGIAPQVVIDTLHWLDKQQHLLDFNWPLADIAELNPRYDVNQHTAKLAARMVHEMISANVQG